MAAPSTRLKESVQIFLHRASVKMSAGVQSYSDQPHREQRDKECFSLSETYADGS